MKNAKDVIISISGLQGGSNPPDSIEFVTNGKYHFEKDRIRLTYQESELTGMEGTETSISVTPEGVIMSREGMMNTRMSFIVGKRDTFLYDTPFGSATMALDTYRIQNRLGEHGGSMEIDYVLDLDHVVVGRNKFKINVREQRI